ncbi:MAG: YdcF family protein [Gammaproteobacteria bacterium]|nr:YdcF family protein [Gammaproteobacteria bacterium]
MANSLFFFFSKILWALLSPGTLILLMALAGTALLFLHQTKVARLLLGASAVILVLITLLPVGGWLATPLEKHFPANPELPRTVDGIILLGGAIDPLTSYIWDQPEFGAAADRYFGFIEMAKRYPRAKLIFTGGAGTLLDQEYKEADVALYFLESMGIRKSRLEIERDSRNTYENAINSKALMNPQPGENWLLVTSATHMPRAVGVFCQQNWPVIPYPVDHETTPGRSWQLSFDPVDSLDDLNSYAREWVGLLVYYITGKTSAFFPEAC